MDPLPPGVAAILLAAGSSRRFGRDKQSALVDGEPLLLRSARLLLEAGFVEPIVVLGERAPEHRALLAGLPVRMVDNPDPAAGMASSLRLGLDTGLNVGRDAGYAVEAALVAVCDQPAVTSSHLGSLVAAWRSGAGIVASSYCDTRGVPALFAARYFADLLGLKGDRGAGPLLATHADVVTVPLSGGEVDIDTPADLARWPHQS
jgi:molybdenum cofactor cytidylyltransferase